MRRYLVKELEIEWKITKSTIYLSNQRFQIKNFIHNIAKAFAPNKTSPIEGIKELNISKSSNNFFELHRTIPGTDLHFIHIYY